MSCIEKVSWMSESGYSDMELLEYINKHFEEIECEFIGEEYKEPKKHDRYFCMDCKFEKDSRLQKVDFGLHQMWFM